MIPSPFAQAGMSVVDAMLDPELFGPLFQPVESWASWIVFLKAVKGLPLTPEELAVFSTYTGRQLAPTDAAREAYLICGRQAGKSNIAALLAVHQALFVDHSAVMKPRQKTVAMLLAQDRKGAGVVFAYCLGLIESVPALKKMIGKVTEAPDERIIRLKNGIDLEVYTASKRAPRGPMAVCVLADETAQWWNQDDAANPDSEVLAAAQPAMLHVPSAFLLSLSSPYARRGTLWDAYDHHFGQDGDPVMVWQAPTLAMYPGADQAIIDAAYHRDAISAAAEYGAHFRTDVAAFITSEVLADSIVPERHELPPRLGLRYSAFVDASGGSADAYTLAIAHREGERAVLDLVREHRPPFSPDQVVEEYVSILRGYRIGTVVGDRYAGELAREPYRRLGIGYTVSERVRSEIYLGVLPMLNSRRVELLDHDRLRLQFLGLERRTSRGGRDSVDHGRHGHDDLANAAAGALVLAGTRVRSFHDLSEEEQEALRPDPDARREQEARTEDHAELLVNIGRLHDLAAVRCPSFDVNRWLEWLRANVREEDHGCYVADKLEQLDWDNPQNRLRRAGLR